MQVPPTYINLPPTDPLSPERLRATREYGTPRTRDLVPRGSPPLPPSLHSQCAGNLSRDRLAVIRLTGVCGQLQVSTHTIQQRTGPRASTDGNTTKGLLSQSKLPVRTRFIIRTQMATNTEIFLDISPNWSQLFITLAIRPEDNL